MISLTVPTRVGPAEAEERAIPFARGRLFRITRQGIRPSWLFGTIHLSDPRVTAFSPALREAIRGARTVALELAPEEGARGEKLFASLGLRGTAKLLAKGPERGDRLLAPGDLKRLEALLAARDLPTSAARVLKPGFLALLLSIPACAAAGEDDDVDTRVGRLGGDAKVRVVGLETADEQISAMTGFAPEIQRDLMIATLDGAPYLEDVHETLIRRYLESRTGAILAISRLGLPIPGLERPLPPIVREAVIDARNRRMRDRALPLLKRGGAVIAVGAAHLPGEQGLARLIENAGYGIEIVE